MALSDYMLDRLGIDREICPYSYRFSVFGTCGGWFEGVCGIESFSPAEAV